MKFRYAALAGLLVLTFADVAFAQGLAGGGIGGVSGPFSSLWNWVESNIIPTLILAAIVVIGFTLIARQHSFGAIVCVLVGIVVVNYAGTISGLFTGGQ